MKIAKHPVEEIRDIRDRLSDEIKNLSWTEIRQKLSEATEKFEKESGLKLRRSGRTPRKIHRS